MCRLFGLIGGAASPSEPWLVSTDRSLLVQSNAHPEMAQTDGWGIGWYPATRTPRVVRGVRGAYESGDRERFVQTAGIALGPVVLGHLRHASNPMHLPHERLIGPENSQPFSYGSYLFAHNGSVHYPREARALLGKLEPYVQGVNDSEILFYLFVGHLDTLGDPVPAFERTIDDLVRVWNDLGRPEDGPYSGLNVLFSRGPNELWAFCHWRGEHGGGLVDRSRPYYQMAYIADAKQVVVGSEPFDSTRSDWRPMENGTYLQAALSHGLVATKTGPIGGLVAPSPEAVRP